MLIILFSCGKHTIPTSKDLFDDDGDQILNYEEIGDNQHIAQVQALNEIQGVLSFGHKKNSHERIELLFDNQINFTNRAYVLLTKNARFITQDEYFSEFAKLRLYNSKQNFDINLDSYNIKLNFKAPVKKDYHLVYVHKDKKRILAPWSLKVDITLSKTDLQNLLSNKSHIILTNNSTQRIQEKTFRVFYSDGVTSTIYYVSRDFGFSNFLKLMKVDSYILSDDVHFFFDKRSDQVEEWWVRDLGNDKVIAKAPISTLKNVFLQGYNLTNIIVDRRKGFTYANANLNNPEGAKVFLKIHPTMTSVGLNAYSSTYTRNNSLERSITCINYYRAPAEEVSVPITIDLFTQEVHFSSLGVVIPNDWKLYEGSDKNGLYWEVGFNSLPPMFIMSLPNKTFPPGHYIGLYNTTCPQYATVITVPVSDEGRFLLEIEAYVEKME